MNLAEITQLKKRYERIGKISIWIALLSSVGVFFAQYYLFVTLLIGLGIYYFLQDKFNKLALVYKDENLKKDIEKTYPNLKYYINKGIPASTIFSDKLLDEVPSFKSEDLLEGKIHNTRFKSCDLHLQKESYSNRGRYLTTSFKGRYYIIELPKRIESPVYVVNQNANKFGLKLGLPNQDLEYIDFNNAFNVYSITQTQAFKVLTPKMMEMLISLKLKYGEIAFLFKENQLSIAIFDGKDAFEMKLYRKSRSNLMKDLEIELNIISSLVEALS